MRTINPLLLSHILKGIEMGLIPVERVIQWADQRIIATDIPEPWLIDLATTRADKHCIISTMRAHGASTQVDDDTLLALVAYGFFHSHWTLEQVHSVLFDRFCATDWKEMTPLRQQIYIYDDEMDWDKDRARRTCQDILQPFRDAGEQLVGDFADD